jgi:hypothetical protein
LKDALKSLNQDVDWINENHPSGAARPKTIPPKELKDLFSGPLEKEQRHLSSFGRDKRRHELFDSNHCDERERVRIKAAAGAGSGAFLTAIPSERALTIAPEAFRQAIRIRLGRNTPRSVQTCVCGKSNLDDFHLLTCRSKGLMIRRHDTVVEMVRRVARESGRHVMAGEPRAMGMEGQGNGGADGIIFDGLGEGRSVAFDVTVIHGEGKGHLGKNHSPLQKAEADKHVKHDNTYRQLNMQVIPMAFEVRGEMGKETVAFLRQLADSAANLYHNQTWSAPTLSQRWSQMLSCCLQRENARNMLELVYLSQVGENRALGTSNYVVRTREPPWRSWWRAN